MISVVRVVLVQALFVLLVVPGVAALAQTDSGLNDNGTVRRAKSTPAATAPGATESSLRVGTLAPGSLTTLFATDNQFAGNTFDLVPNVDMTITSFDMNLETNEEEPPQSTIAVYWRNGTASGFQSNPAGWTLLGTAVVTPAGVDLPTPVPVGGLALTAGNTYGIYVEVQSYPSASMLYSNGGPTTYSNADLELTTLHGKGTPAFSGTDFFPRQWNGTVYYDTAAVAVAVVPAITTVGLAALAALLAGAALFALRRSPLA